MAVRPITYYRNWTSSDTTTELVDTFNVVCLITDVEGHDWTKTGATFLGWNEVRDGTGTMHYPSESTSGFPVDTLYAIFYVPPYTDTSESNLVINHMTLAQYQSITPDPHQLYIIDDGLEYETVNNKVTSLSVEVTEDNYPSARAVYNAVINAVSGIDSADNKYY